MAKKRSRHKWVDWNYTRPADVSIGKVLMLSNVYANTEDGTDYLKGELANVAAAMTCQDGRHYRIIGSTTWVGEYQVVADTATQLVARNNLDSVVAKANNRAPGRAIVPGTILDNIMKRKLIEFITPDQCDKIKTIENSTARVVPSSSVRVIPPNNVSSKEKKNKHMDKTVLKTAINSLTTGQTINLTFLGPKSHLTGDWTVLKVKTGKGKGGSRLMELVNSDKTTLTTGTPESQFILNMTVDGNLIGYSSESEIPQVFVKDTERADAFKTIFKSLKGAEGNKTVTITATVPELTGTFTVNKQSQLRGRGGQIRLDLARVGTNETVEAWSLRHSSIIQTFVIDGED